MVEAEQLEMSLGWWGKVTNGFIYYGGWDGIGSYPESSGEWKGRRKGFEAGVGF